MHFKNQFRNSKEVSVPAVIWTDYAAPVHSYDPTASSSDWHDGYGSNPPFDKQGITGSTLSYSAPTVQTDAAVNVQSDFAQLQSALLSNGGDPHTVVWFQYGPTSSYGSSTLTTQVSGSTTVGYVVAGLTPDTAYHFRAVAENSLGGSYGQDVVFHTAPMPVSPPPPVSPPVTQPLATVMQNAGCSNAPAAPALQPSIFTLAEQALAELFAWEQSLVSSVWAEYETLLHWLSEEQLSHLS